MKKLLLILSIFLVISLVTMPSAEAGWWEDTIDWFKDLFGWGDGELTAEQIAKMMEVTPSTTKICRNIDGKGVCNYVQYAGIRFVFEDEIWKKVEEARSLKGSGIECQVISDGINIARCLDWNYTSRTIEFERKDNAINIPLRKYSLNKSNDRVYDDKVQTTLSFSLTPKTTQTIKTSPGDIIEFGEHSTLIVLNSSGGLLEDSSVFQTSPDSNINGGEINTGGDTGAKFEGFIKFGNLQTNITSGSTINEAWLSLFVTQENNNVIDVRQFENQTWKDTAMTWNIVSSIAREPIVTFRNADLQPGWYYFNVTNWTQNQFDAGNNNMSFRITSDTNAASTNFESSSAVTINQRPFLNITFTVGPALVDLIAPVNETADFQAYVNFTYNVTSIQGTVNNCSLFLQHSFADDWELNFTDTSITETVNQTINITLAYENIYWKVGCYDNLHVQANSSSNNYTRLQPTPVVNLHAPLNKSITDAQQINFTYNVSIAIGSIASCTLYLDGLKNQTDSSITQTLNQTFNLTLNTTNYHTYIIECIDTTINKGNSSKSEYVFNPLNLTAPLGTRDFAAVGVTNENLNWTNFINFTKYCWYEYNNINTSISCNANTTTFTPAALEPQIITLYSNDTYGNIINRSSTWQYAFLQTGSTQDFNVSETSNQKFEVNLSTDVNILQIVSNLNYDGKSYLATSSCNASSDCNIQRFIDIPLVNATEGQNKTFFWELLLLNGTDSFSFNTTSLQQGVFRIHLEHCDTVFTVPALNFTVSDEQNLSRIDNHYFGGNFEYWLGQGTVKQTTNLSTSTINSTALCLTPVNRTMYVDSEIEYNNQRFNDSANQSIYSTRNYYTQNFTITNKTNNITMYLLKKSSATSFILVVLDQKEDGFANALIEIKRDYPDEGLMRIVQIARTGEGGKSIGFYEIEIVDYAHRITKQNIEILSIGKQKIVPESSPFTLTIRVGSPQEFPTIQPGIDAEIQTHLDFNDISNITIFQWLDQGDPKTVSKGRILVWNTFQSRDDVLICNTSLSFSSGAVQCDINAFNGTFLAKGYTTNQNNEEVFRNSIQFVKTAVRDIMGRTGIMLGWFIILTVTLAFIWNPTAMILVYNLAYLFVSLIGFIQFMPLFFFGGVALSLLLIWIMRT